MNKVILKGNLTRDPEVRYTPKGTPVAEFAVATNRRWKDEATGELREEATYTECRAWGRTGELVGQHFSKGRPILLEGRLAQEEWDDKETGKKRRKTLVIVNEFEFCDSGPARGPGGAGSARPPEGAARRPGVGTATGRESVGEVFTNETGGDDIPF